MEALDKNSAEFQAVFSAQVRDDLQAAGTLDAVVTLINADTRLREDVRVYYLTTQSLEPRADDPSYTYMSRAIHTVEDGDAGLFEWVLGAEIGSPADYVGRVVISSSEFADAVRFVTVLSHELSGHFVQRYVSFFSGVTSAEQFADAYLHREGLSHLRQAETMEIAQNLGFPVSADDFVEINFLQQERNRINTQNPPATPEAKHLLLVSAFVNRLSAPDSGPYSRLVEAMEVAAVKQPLAYTVDGQIYGVSVGKDRQGRPFFAYEKGEILVEGIVSVNGACRVYNAGRLQTEATATPAHKRTVRTFDIDQTEGWSEQLERFDSQDALEMRLTLLDNGSQVLDVLQLDGMSLGQEQGEAIARELQANGATPEMIADDSPWLRGILSPSNLGISENEVPVRDDLQTGIAVTNILGGDAASLNALSAALAGGTPSTPAILDSTNELGRELRLWAGDGERGVVSSALGSLAASGLGWDDGTVNITNAVFAPLGADGTLVDALSLNVVADWAPASAPVVTAPTGPLGYEYAVMTGAQWNPSLVFARVDGFGFVNNWVTSAIEEGTGNFLGVDTNVDTLPDWLPPVGEPEYENWFADPLAHGMPSGWFGDPGPGGIDFAPVALDLDGDGVELVSPQQSTARFEHHRGVGRATLGWVAADDGLLAYDHDRDGLITRADEMSFTGYMDGAETDLEGLAAFDSNANGQLDPGDAQWSDFGVWQDANQDGVSQAGEFKTLSTRAIASIDLTSNGVEREQNGAYVFGDLTYTRTDTTQHAAADVSLKVTLDALGDSATVTLDAWAFDLDGDGVWTLEHAAAGVLFDSDNDGYREATAWLNSQDGMLAIDRNGDGRIESASELVTTNDTAAVNHGTNRIGLLDANQDGRLDGSDASFGQLKVWRDINGDALTQPEELKVLVDLGVTSLDYANGTYTADGAERLFVQVHLEADGAGVAIDEVAGGIRIRNQDGTIKTYLKTDGGLLVAAESGPSAGEVSFYTGDAATLNTGARNLVLLGDASVNGAGNDLNNGLAGNAGANRLDGGAGNDVLDGGPGADDLRGGSGNDTYVVDNLLDTVQEGGGSTVNGYQRRVTERTETRAVTLYVAGYAPLLTYYPVTVVDVDYVPVYASGDSGGTDTVNASVSFTLPSGVEILTLTGALNINGTGNDLDNLLAGNAGANVLAGGHGNDTYVVEQPADTVVEAANDGVDTVRSYLTLTLAANTENLVLLGMSNISGTGNAFDNYLLGNDSDNTLDGGLGADNLAGRNGDDTYIVDQSGDVVTEAAGDGRDTIQAAFSYTLPANVENLTLTGSANASATGNLLDNVLAGNAGTNSLYGAAGNDVYYIGAGDTVVEPLTTGFESVSVRAYDGASWGPWVSWTMNIGNRPPTDAPTLPTRPIHVGQSVSAATLFTTADADGDAITSYRFWSAQGGGHFRVDGVDRPDATVIDVAAADLSKVTFFSGAALESDPAKVAEWLQVFDGSDWSAWTNWLMPVTNQNPVASASSRWIHVGQSVQASTLFSAFDADSDSIATYRFWSAQGGGHFRVDGVDQPDALSIDVAAADLSKVTFVGGSAAESDPARVAEWLQVHDGIGWSAWTTWGMNVGNSTPVASAPNASVHVGGSVQVSSLFSVSDLDGDPAVTYRFWSAQGGGHFRLDGVDQPDATNIDVAATDLSRVTFAAGANLDSDPARVSESVQVYDGTAWGAWASWQMPVTNQGPAASAAGRWIHQGQSMQAAALFSASDADSDAIVTYRFWSSQGGGLFRIDGVDQSEAASIDVAAADLSRVTYVGGTAADTDPAHVTEFIQVYDGTTWGPWASWAMNIGNRAPVVTPTAATRWVHPGQSVDAAPLFGVSDADADPITVYRFWSAQGGGHFRVDGVDQPDALSIDVAAADLSRVTFVGGPSPESDPARVAEWLQVYDGAAWSPWATWSVNVGNRAPVVAPSAVSRLIHSGQSVQASTLFGASDLDGDSIATYRFWSSQGGGHFRIDTVDQAEAASIDVAAADLSKVTFVGGSTADSDPAHVNEFMQVYDGANWSDWTNWTMNIGNQAPVVVPHSSSFWVHADGSLQAVSLFSASDPDGDAITRYEFWDSAGNGRFQIDGLDQAEGAAVGVDSADLVKVTYRGPITDSDTVVSTVNYVLTGEIENLFLSDTASEAIGNYKRNIIVAGAADATLRGYDGDDLLIGGSGNDHLDGGAGDDMLAGGDGNDTLDTSAGRNVVVFNRGDGFDTIASDAGSQNTLSLGGLAGQGLALSRSSADLVMEVGSNDRIVFRNWYADRATFTRLQLVDPAGSEPVQVFDFSATVALFAAAQAQNPSISSWSLSGTLAQTRISGGADAAIGADLAYRYGSAGSFGGIGVLSAQGIIGAAGFGWQSQLLRPASELQSGLVTLA